MLKLGHYKTTNVGKKKKNKHSKSCREKILHFSKYRNIYKFSHIRKRRRVDFHLHPEQDRNLGNKYTADQNIKSKFASPAACSRNSVLCRVCAVKLPVW